MLAVEKDYAFAERLEVELGSNPKCKILQGDILRLNIEELISSVKEKHGWAADDPKRVRIVANLPYYITTELLKQLLPLGDKIESLLLLLQDEVAQRLTTEHPGEWLSLVYTMTFSITSLSSITCFILVRQGTECQ